jgi:phospholipid-binding lipoprotein MlaA
VSETAESLQRGWRARLAPLLAALALALAAGCATTNGGDPRDPLEGFNRAMYTFNDAFDEAIGKPVATAYKTVLPDPVRGWVRNFFANIADLFIGVNNLLQGKPVDTVNDWARFAFNSTIGLLGINDVASEMGLEKHNEDFGQTFGRWGAGSGAYIVWPFLGSSTVRDTAGGLLDLYFDPVRRHNPTDARNFALLLRATSQRADLLDASRILEEAALDKYIFQRDAFLQRRRGLIYDGNPPRDPSSSRLRDAGRAQAGEAAPGAADRLFDEPAAAGQVPAERASNSYEPREPANYTAVLAAGARTGQ